MKSNCTVYRTDKAVLSLKPRKMGAELWVSLDISENFSTEHSIAFFTVKKEQLVILAKELDEVIKAFDSLEVPEMKEEEEEIPF